MLQHVHCDNEFLLQSHTRETDFETKQLYTRHARQVFPKYCCALQVRQIFYLFVIQFEKRCDCETQMHLAATIQNDYFFNNKTCLWNTDAPGGNKTPMPPAASKSKYGKNL